MLGELLGSDVGIDDGYDVGPDVDIGVGFRHVWGHGQPVHWMLMPAKHEG